MARLGLPAIALLVLSASAAGAQEITGMAPGSEVTNTVTIGDKQVPLPKGMWTLVRSEAKRRGNLGKIGSVFLIQDTGESGFSAIYIRSNVELSNCTGWKRWKSYCDRTDTHHNESDRNYNPQDAECWNVNHVIFDPYKKYKSKFWNEVNEFLKDRINVTTFLTNEYFKSTRCHFIAARYYADPTDFGFPASTAGRWKNSEWRLGTAYLDPRRENLVLAVKDAGERLRTALDRGFGGKLDGWVSDIELTFE